MVNLGEFSNELTPNWQVAIAVFVLMAAPVFGYFFNRVVHNLGEHEHTSFYVVIGVFVTIALGGLISWRATLLMFILFSLTGLPMITGEFERSAKKAKKTDQKPERGRKRLPYAANGLIDDIKMSAVEMQRHLTQFLESNEAKKINQVQAEVTNILLKSTELKNIQDK